MEVGLCRLADETREIEINPTEAEVSRKLLFQRERLPEGHPQEVTWWGPPALKRVLHVYMPCPLVLGALSTASWL